VAVLLFTTIRHKFAMYVVTSLFFDIMVTARTANLSFFLAHLRL